MKGNVKYFTIVLSYNKNAHKGPKPTELLAVSLTSAGFSLASVGEVNCVGHDPGDSKDIAKK